MLGRDPVRELELRIGRLERSSRQLRGVVTRMRKELDEVSRADAIAKAVAVELDRNREKEQQQEERHLSTIWTRLGIVALVVSTVVSVLGIAAQAGLL